MTTKYRHQNIHPQTAVLTFRSSRMYHTHITEKEMSYLKVGVSIYNYQPSFTVLFRLLFLFSLSSFRWSRRINACAICPINSSIAPLDGAHNKIRGLSARGPHEELDWVATFGGRCVREALKKNDLTPFSFFLDKLSLDIPLTITRNKSIIAKLTTFFKNGNMFVLYFKWA